MRKQKLLKILFNNILVSVIKIRKEIIFIFGNEILDPNSKESIGSVLSNNTSISFFDKAHVISLSIHFIAFTGLKILIQV